MIFKDLDELREWRDKQKVGPVAVNGCFDLLHVGHLKLIEQAYKRTHVVGSLGTGPQNAQAWQPYREVSALVIGINDDESVRELKGEERPILKAKDRAQLLAALRFVDHVAIFSGLTATGFLEAARPRLWVKGDDYSETSVDQGELALVRACGGEVEFVSRVPGVSTTGTLLRFQQHEIQLR